MVSRIWAVCSVILNVVSLVQAQVQVSQVMSGDTSAICVVCDILERGAERHHLQRDGEPLLRLGAAGRHLQREPGGVRRHARHPAPPRAQLGQAQHQQDGVLRRARRRVRAHHGRLAVLPLQADRQLRGRGRGHRGQRRHGGEETSTDVHGWWMDNMDILPHSPRRWQIRNYLDRY